MTTITPPDAPPSRWPPWLRPSVITIFLLGFSAGLPFLLVYSTLTVWLEEAGVARAQISAFAWIGFAYSFKFLWAPLVDAIQLPVLSRWLGRRRSWLLLTQLIIAFSLFVLSGIDPAEGLRPFTLLVVLTAVMSATQDIVIDAYRVESDSPRMQGVLAASYQYGYRVAIIVSGAFALYLAEWFSWSLSYKAMAVLMGVGMITVLCSPEPDLPPRQLPESVGEWLMANVVRPLLELFFRVRWLAVPILLYIFCFRISDYVLGILANPFYLDIGFSKSEIANVAKLYGLIVSLIGVAAGGVSVLRLGIYRSLIVASVLIATTNLFFVFLALQGPQTWALAVTISGDNFAQGYAGTALIAYLSSLTNRNFTATQYALFSSLSTLVGKLIAGFSGRVQQWPGWEAMLSPLLTSAARDADWAGWVGFFGYAALTGVPSIVLAIVIAHPRLRPQPINKDTSP